MKNKIEVHFDQIRSVLNKDNSTLIKKVKKITKILEKTILSKKKVLVYGNGGGVLKKISDYSIIIESFNTGTIQEMHKIILHSICNYLEDIKK